MEIKEKSQEERNANEAKLYGFLLDAGLPDETSQKIIEKIKNAPGAINVTSGIAYPGGLISHIVLSALLAMRVAKMISGTFNIDKSSLLKASCLMHISKSDMFVENENDWEVRNRGYRYRFVDSDNRLKFGLRSIVDAMELGITLTDNEVEAMTCFDREQDTKDGKWFDNILTSVIRMANELAYSIEIQKEKSGSNH